MRLIDADVLIKKFEINFSTKPEAQAIYQHLIDIVDDAPTVNKCDNCDLMFLEKTGGKEE